jgi:hypothetical protein
MIRDTQLYLLKNKLGEVLESPYFSKSLILYLEKLKIIVDKIINADHIDLPENIIDYCIQSIFTATRFFTGSTTKKVPYEIVYCLEQACLDWTKNKSIITTELSQNILSFYFIGVHQNFYILANSIFGVDFDSELVQICLPDLYRRRPLYATPLYHELGHFVDVNQAIVEQTFLKKDIHFNLPNLHLVPELSGSSKDHNLLFQIQKSHRMEYFADLFSAKYIGRSGVEFLNEIAGEDPPSKTHPSTQDRIKVVDDFLNGIQNDIIDMFNTVLKSNNLPLLQYTTTNMDISRSFNNIRPYEIKNKDELHAFIGESWIFLREMFHEPKDKWAYIPKVQIEKSVNDLVEKSLRNYMIIKKWDNDGAAI